jgi:phosphoglycolate phosphatase-like HAD superfamily hydrolase
MLGDSDVDVQSARAAGIRVVGVTYGIGEWDESTKPDEVIDEPIELLGYLS